MKQQTAVEFLLSHIWTTDWVNYTREEKLEVIEKAKQMEKQEIKDAFHDGRTWNNSWNEETYFVEVYEKNGRYL